MTVNLTRCPQTEADATDYVFTLFQRVIGTPAPDWASVMANTNLPHNVYTPGLRADASWPFFGITQMWGDGGPRGRVFLPATAPDEKGYITRQIQVIADDGRGGLVWSWTRISGHEYQPVQGAEDGPSVPPGTSGGLTEAQVQAMIDASLVPVQAELARALKMGSKTALKMDSGLYVGFVSGGPTADGQPVELVAKTEAHAWEMVEHNPEGAQR
jgi:hypothetical protein